MNALTTCRLLPLCIALAVGGLALSLSNSALAKGKTAIGIGPGFFIQNSTQDFTVERGGNKLPQDEVEWDSDGLFNINAWFLTPVLHPNLRFGGGIAWYNKYTLRPPDTNDPDSGSLCVQTDQCMELGHLFQLYWQGDFTIPKVASDLGVVLGVRFGALTLFPGGDLKAKLVEMDNQGFSVFPGLPRLGFFAGPHVGVLWPLSDRLDLRADVGAQFSRLYLYDGTAEAAGVPDLRDASALSTTRYALLLGVEIGL